MTNLKKIRQEIDEVDKSILSNIRKREVLINKIKIIKEKGNIVVTDKEREKIILEKTKNKFEKEIFKKIIEESKKLQVKSLPKE